MTENKKSCTLYAGFKTILHKTNYVPEGDSNLDALHVSGY